MLLKIEFDLSDWVTTVTWINLITAEDELLYPKDDLNKRVFPLQKQNWYKLSISKLLLVFVWDALGLVVGRRLDFWNNLTELTEKQPSFYRQEFQWGSFGLLSCKTYLTKFGQIVQTKLRFSIIRTSLNLDVNLLLTSC